MKLIFFSVDQLKKDGFFGWYLAQPKKHYIYFLSFNQQEIDHSYADKHRIIFNFWRRRNYLWPVTRTCTVTSNFTLMDIC